MADISVIVCTYNRVDRLRDCIESLLNQSLNDKLFEIIIVDNGSSDKTRDYIYNLKNEGRIHYFYESCIGLSYARNRGVEEASGNYLAFIDDDAKAAPNWLQNVHNLIHILDPSPDCLGGPILPFYTSPKPVWFEDKYETRKIANSPMYLKTGASFSGSNMIWNRESFQKVGKFDLSTGMIGEKLRLGEETDAFNRLWHMNDKPKLYFSPEILVYHWVPSYKMKVFYRLKRKFIEGQFKTKQAIISSEKNNFKFFMNTLKNLIKSVFDAIIKIFSYLHIQNWAVEEGTRIAIYLGSTIGFLSVFNLSKSTSTDSLENL